MTDGRNNKPRKMVKCPHCLLSRSFKCYRILFWLSYYDKKKRGSSGKSMPT